MPSVSRVDDTANHDPVNGWSEHTIQEGSPDTTANGKDVARAKSDTNLGDPLNDHTNGDSVHFPEEPTPRIDEGSPNVFVNGQPIARVGDLVDCSSKILSGSNDVFAN